jgi:hypothetical protein
MINLFVGVVISNFNREKERLGKDFLLSKNQKKWLETKLMIIKAKPKKFQPPPSSDFRKTMYSMSKSVWMDYFIYTCIMTNTFVLAFSWYDQPNWVSVMTEVLNYIFCAIFTVEAAIKIGGLGKMYFKSSWNVFDFIIVVGTYIGIVMKIAVGVNLGPQTTVIRAFRVGRMFRLLKRNKSLKIIF